MIKNKNQKSKHVIYLDANNLHGYAISKFCPTSGFKCIDSKDFDLNKYNSNSSKDIPSQSYFEYPKELRELHNNYPLAQIKQK